MAWKSDREFVHMKRHEISYSDHMRRLTPNAVYDGLVGYGLFSEKLPPVFSSEAFLAFCKAHPDKLYLPNAGDSYNNNLHCRHYVQYESNRNNKDFRQLGIPNPFAYELLCRYIKDNWPSIQAHLIQKTETEAHRISRTHIRKFSNSPVLFKMNYKSISERVKNPVLSFLKAAKYCVKADISSCFPAIYSHALAWAIAGKEEAKRHSGEGSYWYNVLDKYTRGIKYGETNGLIIGPHVSNLLSELILVVVDFNLYQKGYKFVRHIDDYDCYVETREKADAFIYDLSDELRNFSLVLNRKKTKILELPIGQDEGWVRRLNTFKMLMPKDRWSFDAVRGYLDCIVDLMKETGDLAIISYAMKIASRADMTDDARGYYVEYMMHLAILYPYLYQFLDESLFQACNVDFADIAEFSRQMYSHGLEVRNREEMIYSLYFAVKYGFSIPAFSEEAIINQNNAILDVMGFLYEKSIGVKATKIGEVARSYGTGCCDLNRTLDQFWPLVYEVNRSANIKNPYFAELKNAGVSFLRSIEDIRVKYDPNQESVFPDWQRYCSGFVSFDVIGNLIGKFRSKTRLRKITEMHNEAMSSIVANFYVAVSSRCNLAIPRSLSYFDKYPIVSHSGKILDGEIVRRIIDWLKCNQYIGERIGGEGEGPTTYWAKDKFLKELQKLPAQEIAAKIENDHDYVVLKDKKKQILWNTNKTDKAKWYQQCLERINATLASHVFECYTPLGGTRRRFSPRLRAIFNNESWDDGGRLYAVLTKYGVNYQDIPSDYRNTITIDGNPTIELDYGALHISMLYAQEGVATLADPYDIANLPRAFVKKALLVIINADDRTAALKSLENDAKVMQNRTLLSKKKHALKQAYQECGNIDSVLTTIERHHVAIAKHFYTGEGIKLQNKDSLMAIEILNRFVASGIPVLPVHDSFIIEKSQERNLRAVMEETFERYNGGSKCVVKGPAGVVSS